VVVGLQISKDKLLLVRKFSQYNCPDISFYNSFIPRPKDFYVNKFRFLCFANGHPLERQKLGHLRLQDNEPYDEDVGEDGSEYGMMGIRIPYGFRSKDMAYVLFHNGKAYMFSYLNSYFSPALFRIFVNFEISHHHYILCFHYCPRFRYLPIAVKFYSMLPFFTIVKQNIDIR
jgi:hypothetical protein